MKLFMTPSRRSLFIYRIYAEKNKLFNRIHELIHFIITTFIKMWFSGQLRCQKKIEHDKEEFNLSFNKFFLNQNFNINTAKLKKRSI